MKQTTKETKSDALHKVLTTQVKPREVVKPAAAPVSPPRHPATNIGE